MSYPSIPGQRMEISLGNGKVGLNFGSDGRDDAEGIRPIGVVPGEPPDYRTCVAVERRVEPGPGGAWGRRLRRLHAMLGFV